MLTKSNLHQHEFLRLLKVVFKEVRKDMNNPWNRSVEIAMGKIGRVAFEGRKVQLEKALLDHAVATVLSLKREHPSLIAMSQPEMVFPA